MTKELVAVKSKNGSKGVMRVIPNLKNNIAPVLNVTRDVQGTVGYCLKKVTVSESGMWHSSVSVSCKTTNLHT